MGTVFNVFKSSQTEIRDLLNPIVEIPELYQENIIAECPRP